MDNKIEGIFMEKMRDVACLSFYKGSKPLTVSQIENLIVHQIQKGDFHGGFNYSVHGSGDFFISTSDGCSQSNGAGEHFEIYIRVEDGKIVNVARINITTYF